MKKPTSGERRCYHKGEKKKLGGGRVRCLSCGKEYTSPCSPVQHGTTRGWNRHRALDSAQWPWPAPEGSCGCLEAQREYRRSRHEAPSNRAVRHVRDASRQAALLELKRQFPGEFLKHYQAQLSARGEGRRDLQVQAPLWDDLMEQLLKAALERDVHDLEVRAREGWGTPRERQVIRLSHRLRALFVAEQKRQEGRA